MSLFSYVKYTPATKPKEKDIKRCLKIIDNITIYCHYMNFIHVIFEYNLYITSQ